MTKRRASGPQTGPSGITLTEILISIMILAIGLVSLATLFPIGLLRLREAQRSSRSAILSESTVADVLGRGLLDKTTFIDPTISPWYANPNVPYSYDPWIQDTPTAFGDWTGGNDITVTGAYRGYGGLGAKADGVTTFNQVQANGAQWLAAGYSPLQPGQGLPVAYDPLWWYQQGTQPYASNGDEARFGDGTVLGLTTGAHGLQRLTNIPAFIFDGAGNLVLVPYRANEILSAFVSPEDILWQDAKNTSYIDFFNPTLALASTGLVTSPSPVVPDLSTAALAQIAAVEASGGTAGVPAAYAAMTNDWRYTWMFVGQRADAFNDKVFTGNVVIFENRPFGFETLVNQNTGDTITQVAGERVLQAIFGYGTNVIGAGTMVDGGTAVGYAVGSDNSVLLLWPAGFPDPEIRPGGWIADVTYERNESVGRSLFQINSNGSAGSPPAQRCYWYQTRRASPPAPADALGYAGMRYTLIQTTQKLQAKTLLQADGTPYHNNVALVSPHIIGVVPKTFSIP